MRALLSLFLALLPTAALAHTGHGDASGLLHGFMHPIAGIDHVLAMVAVGVFAFILGGRALYLVPLSFVGMMAVGFLLRIEGIEVPFVELGIAVSSVVIGGGAASGRPMPVIGAMALVGVFAVFHGHAHGAGAGDDDALIGLQALFFTFADLHPHLDGIAVGELG